MRVMLGSGGFRTEERVQFLSEQMRSFFGEIDRLLFIPYALQDHDAYVQSILDRKLNAGYEIDPIHRHSNSLDAVNNASAIYVGGGNTFRLLTALHRFNLIEAIGQRVHAGVPYLGISAGANVACPTIQTTNDMPIVTPDSFRALGLVPFQLNPHYYPGHFFLPTPTGYEEHFGETRDDRIREFHELNDTPVIGLWEAGILRLEADELRLHGTPARIFIKGQPAKDVSPGSSLKELLTTPM